MRWKKAKRCRKLISPPVNHKRGNSVPIAKSTVYHHTFRDSDGDDLPLAAFAGKAMLLVNTASMCGFTGQYRGLQSLYEHFGPQGLVIIAMPCNDFGRQEPACIADVKQFTARKFSINFPLTDKVNARGREQHPFFAQVREELGGFAVPRWNFYKYVVDRSGYLTQWFSPLSGPESGKIITAVEAAL